MQNLIVLRIVYLKNLVGEMLTFLPSNAMVLIMVPIGVHAILSKKRMTTLFVFQTV